MIKTSSRISEGIQQIFLKHRFIHLMINKKETLLTIRHNNCINYLRRMSEEILMYLKDKVLHFRKKGNNLVMLIKIGKVFH